MNRHIFIILIILVIAVAGYLWFQGPELDTLQGTPTDNSTEQGKGGEDRATSVSQEEWRTYASPDREPLGFRLEHPDTTSVRQVQEGIYEIKYIGPGSEPNTEITDGYFVSMQFVAIRDPEAYALAQDIASTSVAVTFVGRDAYRFQTESVLNEEPVTHYAFRAPTDASTTVDVSFQVYGESSARYKSEVLNILRTLTFTGTPDESVLPDNDLTELINISSPEAAVSVGNPIELSGEARGQWYFEASAPVVVVDWDGRIIGESFITAEDDWMTEDFVSFSGSITYDLPDDSYSASGTVIFQRANPSGLLENDAAVEVPVVLK